MAQRLEYFSETSDLCSFFSPPSTRGRASPLCDELTHSSPWNLAMDTAFEDCESHGDGCAYSSTSTLCDALGFSTPNSPISPTSPSFKSFTSDSPRSENGGLFAETHPTVDISEQIAEPNAAGKGPTVFVWDMDETLIIFQTLLDGRYVELFDGFKNSHKGTLLGRRWERLILEVCDEYFFFKHVEEYNYSNVESLQEYDDGVDLDDYKFEDNSLKPPLNADDLRKLRYLHRYISQLYEQDDAMYTLNLESFLQPSESIDILKWVVKCCVGLQTLLSPEQAKEWGDLYEATDTFTDGWLSAGRQKLEELQRANEQVLQEQFQAITLSDGSDKSADPHKYNFLVTSGTLIPSLVKCLLFKLNPYFNPSNIFSSREIGKLQCCRWIRERFLQSENFPNFCVIGDGPDEGEAARVLAWPFVKISTDPDSRDQLPMLSLKTIEEQMKAVHKDSDTLKGRNDISGHKFDQSL